MKKKVSLITALIISLTSLNALVEIDSYTYDVFTGKMTITGKTESGKENRSISLNVYNPEKGGTASLQYADTTDTDKDGRFEFTFKLHKNGSTDFGEYKIAVVDMITIPQRKRQSI